VYVFSQQTHIRYRNELNFSGIFQHTDNKLQYRELDNRNNVLHIILLDKNKSLAYNDNSSVIIGKNSSDTITRKKIPVKIFDKKKKMVKKIEYIIDSPSDMSLIQVNKFEKWQKIDEKYLKNRYETDDNTKSFLSTAYKDSVITFPEYKITFDLTGNKKEINGYTCKEAIIGLYEDEKYTVWFTDEFDYSWCFDDLFSIVPGTVIQASLKDKTVFELLDISTIKYDDIIFSEEQLNVISELF
jgi:GLPGLI family protein